MSAGELTLTIMRKSGTRVVTRLSQVHFVPRRGIMLQLDPYFPFYLLVVTACVTYCPSDTIVQVTFIVLIY